MRVIKGQKHPMQGWGSPQYTRLVPSPILISKLTGIGVEYVTVIQLPTKDQAFSQMQRVADALQVTKEGDVISIHWHTGGRNQWIKVNLNCCFLCLF